MIKIGIVGSDNSHADRFSEICNLDKIPAEQRIKGAKVVAICGKDQDPKRTEEVARNNNIPLIVEKPEELIGKIDAALVVYRNGALHAPNALPLIKAGIPTFVDKPFALTVKDAVQMIKAAEKAKSVMTSYSTLRFLPDFVKWRKDLRAIGKITVGAISGPANNTNPWGGFAFYGVHTIEIMQELFGTGVAGINTTEVDGNASVAVAYKKDSVVALNLLCKPKYNFHAVVFGDKGMSQTNIGSGAAYVTGLKLFLRAVRTGKLPVEHDNMLEVVKIVEALTRSLKQKRAVKIS